MVCPPYRGRADAFHGTTAATDVARHRRSKLCLPQLSSRFVYSPLKKILSSTFET